MVTNHLRMGSLDTSCVMNLVHLVAWPGTSSNPGEKVPEVNTSAQRKPGVWGMQMHRGRARRPVRSEGMVLDSTPPYIVDIIRGMEMRRGIGSFSPTFAWK